MDTDQTTPDFVLATYAEIQARFRLSSSDAARIKAKRRKWAPEPANHPGALTVIRVPRNEWDQADQAERSPGSGSEQPRTNKDLEAIKAIMGEERDRLFTERDKLIGERDRLQAEALKLREEREEARVRAALAEGEARALREALTDARRPFWRRWIG